MIEEGKKYVILSGTIDAIEKSVNEYIANGYEPAGGLVFEQSICFQAVIKKKEHVNLKALNEQTGETGWAED